MMQVIVTVVRQNLGKDAIMLDRAAELLSEALKEPIDAMPPGRASKILRRAMRATGEAMTAISDRMIGVQWRAIAHLAVELADEDYLVVGSDSAFARAWDVMAETIGKETEDVVDEACAVEAAAILKRRLAAAGFFRAA